jgi:undecaprenyl-diphosphatase
MNFLKSIDLAVLTFVNHLPHGGVLVGIADFFTNIGNGGFIWFCLAFGFLVVGGRKGTRVCFLIVSGLVVDFLLNESLVKHLINRARPYNSGLLGLNFWDTRWHDSSFFSGHAFSAFLCAYLIGRYYPKTFWPLMTVAALISFSRIYLAAHWPSDVIVGSILGLAFGWLIIFIDKKYFKKQ